MKAIFLLCLTIVFGSAVIAQTISITYDALGNRQTKSVTGTYPKPIFSGDSVICQGDTAHLYASGGATYLWNNGKTGSSIAFPADTTRTYSVTAYSSIGCATTVQRLLTVKPVPVTGPVLGDTVVYVGDATVYNVPQHTGSFYDWGLVNGGYGYIDTGYSRRAISIRWTKPGVDTIEVYERLPNGCNSLRAKLRVTVLTRTGVPSVARDEAISVYPNPTNSGARVNVRLSKTEDVLLIITDNLGRKLGSISLSGQSRYDIPINKSFFPASGIYYIQITHGGSTSTQKLSVIY